MANLGPGKKRQSSGDPPVERDWQPLARLRNDVETLVERYLSPWQKLSEDLLSRGRGRDLGRGWGMEVNDEEDAVVVRVEAPGFEAEDFDLQVRGNQLIVTAERQEEDQEPGLTTICSGRFERVIPLPGQIDVNKVQARYHSGVLEVRIPKGKDAQRKRIAVKKG
jgi:HSP20 family protein